MFFIVWGTEWFISYSVTIIKQVQVALTPDSSKNIYRVPPPKKKETWQLVRQCQSFWAFEIRDFIGRIFHRGFSALSDLKNFEFKGPKSKCGIFKNSQKQGILFFFSSQFFGRYKCRKNPNHMLLTQNYITTRFLES